MLVNSGHACMEMCVHIPAELGYSDVAEVSEYVIFHLKKYLVTVAWTVL